ncbi:MAG TPA: hypothetical protein VGG74_07350 [Kofleriaceae bacterium]|jgi:hypothetical protein
MESNEIHHTNEGHSGASRFSELQALVAKMGPDFEKFYKDGNKAAGTRVRNAMQELKTFAQMIRTEVQTMKNGGAAAGDAKDDSDA